MMCIKIWKVIRKNSWRNLKEIQEKCLRDQRRQMTPTTKNHQSPEPCRSDILESSAGTTTVTFSNDSISSLEVLMQDISHDRCGSVGCVSSHKAKGHWFNSWSGHMPGLWVQSPVGACMRGSRSIFLFHINVSLSLFLPLFSFLQK